MSGNLGLLFLVKFIYFICSSWARVKGLLGLNGVFYNYLLNKPSKFGYGSGSTGQQISRKYRDNIKGKTIIITGCNSGIGYETARSLACNGANIIMAVRNTKKGLTALKEIKYEHPQAKLYLEELDLNSLKSVRAFVDRVKKSDKLNKVSMLINNAGIAFQIKQKTEEGYERQFGVNYIGHYVLTSLLIDLLHKNGPSRIINVSSIAYLFAQKGKIDWNKVLYYQNNKNFNQFTAYGNSKLANVLHARFLAKEFKNEGLKITINSCHPGNIATTGLINHKVSNFQLIKAKWSPLTYINKWFLKTPQQGCATQVLIACHPKFDTISGEYLEDCFIRKNDLSIYDPSDIDTLAEGLRQFSLKFASKPKTLN